MHKLLTILFLLFSFVTHAQRVITGKVIDAKTEEAIPFVNIYIIESQNGTVTNIDGEFEFKNFPQKTTDVLISCVGYQSKRQTISLKNTKEVLIKLNEDEIFLSELEISAGKDKVWKKKYKRFRNLMLGTDKFGKQCEILNPWVLEFTEDDKNFIATSTKLLEIRNNALGYDIYYYLEKFSHNSHLTIYSGLTSFKALSPKNLTEYKRWQENRKIAYNGSINHFFKVLIADSLETGGFFATLSTKIDKSKYSLDYLEDLENNKLVSAKDIFNGDSTARRLNLRKVLRLKYFGESTGSQEQQSWIEQTGLTKVDDNGILSNPAAVTVHGFLADEKVAYFLPNDYQSNANNNDVLQFRNNVIKPYEKFVFKNPTEKIHVQTDKDLYFQNETLWLKAYLNVNDSVSILSNKLYLQLSRQDSIVYQTILPIKNGTANGYLEIGENLKNGKYLLSAHTNYTDSLSSNYFFKKEIDIGISDAQSTNNNQAHKRLISFYPEGGNLIPEIINRVAFEIKNESGTPSNESLLIKDSNGKTVLKTQSSWQGKGTFSFKPNKNEKYFGELESVDFSSDTLHVSNDLSTGIILSHNDNKMSFQIKKVANVNDIVYLLISSNDQVKYFKSIEFKKNTLVEVPKNILGDGVNQITFFDLNHKPFWERLIFKQPNLNETISLDIAQKTMKPRSMSTIKLGNSKQIRSAALSVIDENQAVENGKENIYISTYLRPEIKGAINSSEKLFNKSKESIENIDLLMLVNGWRKYDWKKITSSKVNSILPDSMMIFDGFNVSGLITKKINEKPISNQSILLIASDSTFRFYESKTDENGRFFFPNIVYYDSTKISIKIDNKLTQKNVNVSFDPIDWNYIYENSKAISLPEIIDKNEIAKQAAYRAKLNEVYDFEKTYYLNEVVIKGQNNPIKDSNKSIKGLISPASAKTVYIDSVRNPTTNNLQGFINEYFTGATITTSNFYSGDLLIVYRGKPVVIFYDGLPQPHEAINGIDYKNLERVEVVENSVGLNVGFRRVGAAIFLYSKKNKGNDQKEEQFVKELKGYQSSKKFYGPDYSKETDYIPDFRTTLYWNPDINSNSNQINFYNHDNESKIKVILEGFSTDGKPFRVISNYNIKK